MLPNQQNYESRLEAEIDRELKALPEIPAPASLIIRVMRAIAERQALPWFRRAWQTWPMSLRVVSFALLAILFAGLSFGAIEATRLGTAAATARYGSIFSLFTGLWTVVNALFVAIVSAVNQLPRGVLIGCVAAVCLAYAMCAALGTMCVALVRNTHRFEK